MKLTYVQDKILKPFILLLKGVQRRQKHTKIALIAMVLLIAYRFIPSMTQQDDFKTYTVQTGDFHKTLYFNGTVEPLRETSLTSPADAVIYEMPIGYGQRIKPGEVIFALNSSELQKQFNDTLAEYLKAKDAFSIAKTKFNGTQDLWEAGLIPKNTYLSEKSSLDNSRIGLIQAERKLKEMQDKMEETDRPRIGLNLADSKEIKAVLTKTHKLIPIKSNTTGVLLYPPSDNGATTKKLGVGHRVKAGEVLGLVGDLSGIHIEIDIPEVDIAKVYVGMKARVSGVAFRDPEIEGEIVSINAQASNQTNTNLPTFSAIVAIKQLTPKQQEWLKVGMSATVALNIDEQKKLTIPIEALHQRNGHAIVYVVKNHKTLPRMVKTGEALESSVAIESGLTSGEIIAYEPNSTH